MANEVAIIETRAAQLAEKIEVLVTEARQKVASERLAERLGKGRSVDTHENARNFYNIYAKSEPVVRKFDVSIDKIQNSGLEISSSTEIRQQLADEKSQRVVGLMNGGKKSQQVVDQIEVTEKGHQLGDQLDGEKKKHQVGGQIGWFIKNDTSCAAISNESCGTGCYRTNSPRFILYSMRHHVYNFTKSNRRNEV